MRGGIFRPLSRQAFKERWRPAPQPRSSPVSPGQRIAFPLSRTHPLPSHRLRPTYWDRLGHLARSHVTRQQLLTHSSPSSCYDWQPTFAGFCFRSSLRWFRESRRPPATLRQSLFCISPFILTPLADFDNQLRLLDFLAMHSGACDGFGVVCGTMLSAGRSALLSDIWHPA